MVPVCQRQDIATLAWEELTRAANVDGLPAQFVNVTVDDGVRWNILNLWWREVYTVSADVIVYR
jgi:hypothetical protein